MNNLNAIIEFTALYAKLDPAQKNFVHVVSAVIATKEFALQPPSAFIPLAA
jgi:hypothetical protein